MNQGRWMGAVAGAVLLGLSTTAGAADFEFAPQEGQTNEFVRGQQLVFAEGEGAAVAISYVDDEDQDGWIQVSVQNRSEAPFNVQETSLVAARGDAAVQTYTYADLEKSQSHKAIFRRVLGTLAAGANGYAAGSAGYRNTSGTYNAHTTATAYGGGGSATAYGTTSGTYSATTYDPAAAAAAQSQAQSRNQAMLAQINSSELQAHASLEARALRMNTVHPGETITGQIRIDMPSKSKVRDTPVSIDFTAGTETFHFVLATAGQ